MPHPPTARGDLVLMTAGRRGTDEDTLAVCGAILMDAALGGVIDVERQRLRTRVVPGPGAPAGDLMADLRRRVEAAKPDSPFGWCERVAVFGEDAVARELIDAGLARPLRVAFWKSAFRHKTLEVDEAEAARATQRVLEQATPHAVAAAAALRETELLSLSFARGDRKRIEKGLDDRIRTLPEAAQAIVGALAERRRRDDRVSHYAD